MLGFLKGLLLVAVVLAARLSPAQAECPPAAPLPHKNENMRVFANVDTLIRVVQFADRQVVSIFGALYPRDFALTQAAQDTLIENKKTVVLTLFRGGTTSTVRGMINRFREKCPKHTCEIHTQVLPSTKCASNCITMFMMGDVRIATPTSHFGFHSATLGGVPKPGVVEEIYKDMGVSEEWLRRNNALFASTEVTYLRPEHLEDSNIVTKLVTVSTPVQTSPQTIVCD